jgi:type II secretory ATPase GspE/PulE/Tfp pilus assembly ATPase PilB-like protein
MELTPELRRMVHTGAATHELRDKLSQMGVLTLRQEGVVLALEGRTSLEEVMRVTRSENEEVTDRETRRAAA